MAKWGKTTNIVRELCRREIGASLREVADAIDRPLNVSSGFLAKLIKEEGIHKAGSHGEFRYFYDKDCADRHDIVAKEQRAIRAEEMRKKKNAARAAREREKRAQARAAKGLAPYVKPEPKPRPPKKVKLAPTASGINLAKNSAYKDLKRQHLKANIVWPEGVQVQKIPHGEDYRYKFVPEPGWRGQITQDWYDRRLGA